MMNLKLTRLLFLFILLSGKIVFAQIQGVDLLKVDHRYNPPWWQTLICMPDDPLKTLVGKEGQVFGDFGYGGPRDFSFSVQFDSKTPAIWKSQGLVAAQAPVTHTIKESNGIRIEEFTFLQIPLVKQVNNIVRFDSRRIIRNWSKPSVQCDVAFQDIAEGKQSGSGEGLVIFHIKVSPGSSHKMALGFCEGFWKTPGQRVMKVHIEGAPLKEIDPVQDFGPNKPGVYFFSANDINKNGIITVAVSNAPGSIDGNAFINGIWMFKNQTPSSEVIISGKANHNCELYVACAEVPMPERCYHMLVNLKNTTEDDKVFNPVIRYTGKESLKKEDGLLRIGNETFISSSNSFGEITTDTDSAHSFEITLNPVLLKPGEKKMMTLTINRFYNPRNITPASVANSVKQKEVATAWWQKNSASADAIQVPDVGIQGMVASCIRNIFQARDIRDGKPSFNVGPTCYRGLWIADGTFILETATMLDYVKDVRGCIDYLTSFQLPGGGFNMINTFHKENGLVMYMLIRHAMLTQDKQWLLTNWNVIEGCIRRIDFLRQIALKDSNAPYYGMLPPGQIDGGILTGNDYSNTEWCLSGMKLAIKAAKWIGKNDEATAWQKKFDDLLSYFTKSAMSDLQKDDKGNTYLPVLIHNEGNYPPQKGQWAFCQSVYPGQLFDVTPELHKIADGTVEMLSDHLEEGLVLNTGWMNQGLWNYFSSFYGHALLWQGKGKKLPQLLYDFANHSSPTMVWREEQNPVGKGKEEVGDMPHNWASAEFIRMLVHMIELDRGDELHLFEGLPKQWVKAGDQTRLTGIRTPFGRINLVLTINSAGDSAKLSLTFLDKNNLPSKIVIHKEAWGTDKTETVNPSQKIMKIIHF